MYVRYSRLKILLKLLDRSQREEDRGVRRRRRSFPLHSVMYFVTFLYRRARSKFASWTAISVDVMTMQRRMYLRLSEILVQHSLGKSELILFRELLFADCLGSGSTLYESAHLEVVSCVVSPSRIPISRTRSRSLSIFTLSHLSDLRD